MSNEEKKEKFETGVEEGESTEVSGKKESKPWSYEDKTMYAGQILVIGMY